MYHYLPEIVWHDRDALLSLHLQQHQLNTSYKMVTSSVRREVRIWTFNFEKNSSNVREALAVNFVANLTGHRGAVNVARFSPSGEYLATGDCEGVLIIWKIGAAPCVQPPTDSCTSNDDIPPNRENWVRYKLPLRHDSDVCSLTWSPDGNFFATASNDESISSYDAITGKRMWLIKYFRRFPNGIVWDPRGKYIVTMSTDRKMDIICASNGTKLRSISSVNLPKTSIGSAVVFGNRRLFHDDQLMSFNRIPDFSPDGELLFVPCGHLETDDSSLFGTYVFRRRDFNKDRPSAFIPSKKPTYRVLSCPIIFNLRDDTTKNCLDLPYRVIWAVMTRDTIALYDSQYCSCIAFLNKLHYSSLTDISWSSDGKILLASSLEGYCSFVKFDLEVFGDPFTNELPNPPLSPELVRMKKAPKIQNEAGKSPPKSRTNMPPEKLATLRSVTPKKAKYPVNSLFKYLNKDEASSSEKKAKREDSFDFSESKHQPESEVIVTRNVVEINEIEDENKSDRDVEPVKKRAKLESVPLPSS